jgi:hypothetical protein
LKTGEAVAVRLSSPDEITVRVLLRARALVAARGLALAVVVPQRRRSNVRCKSLSEGSSLTRCGSLVQRSRTTAGVKSIKAGGRDEQLGTYCVICELNVASPSFFDDRFVN